MHKKITIVRKAIVLLLCFTTNIFADVSGDLDNFFTGLGYDGNLTPGTAYHGQAAGYYSGGSAVLRNKVRNVQVVHVDLPSLRAGCGGIDMFTGGFSFVNAESLVKFFQQVMSNSGGYAFNLALETVTPGLAHAMQYIQNMAQEINSSNFNSCEMAENLVGGAWPRTAAAQRHICKGIGSHRNIFSDWADARQKCSEESDYSNAMNKASDDPNYKHEVVRNKNLIWDAIQRVGFLSSDQTLAELFMSLSGTIIYDATGKAHIFEPLAKDPKIIKALLHGGTASIYKCDEKIKCINPVLTDTAIGENRALYVKIKISINEIVTLLISDNQALPPKIQGFLELTKLPILKFITTNLMTGNAAMAFSITNYSESIAKTLLMQYMQEALKTVETSLAGTDYSPEIHKQLVDQIHQALIYVEAIKTESRHDIQELMMFMKNSKETEREVMTGVTGQLQHSMGVR